MDVIFEPQRGRPFTIEVGFFDTVQEIKEKIQKYQGIPISRQTLVFKSQVLEDESNIEHSEILQNSHVQLIIDQLESSNNHEPPPQPPPRKIKVHIIIKSPPPSTSNNTNFTLEVEPTETIASLKEKINKAESIPIDSFNVLHANANGSELQDHLTIGEAADVENSELTLQVVIKNNYYYSSPTTTPNNNNMAIMANNNNNNNNLNKGAGASSNKLRVMVLIKGGPRKIPVEVNAGDSVGDLRKELHRLQQRMNFCLPPEGYFFIYRQNVMDEDRSYWWHHVGHGDTIEIFNGSVTGGS